jgi:hypothetical protein
MRIAAALVRLLELGVMYVVWFVIEVVPRYFRRRR